MPATVSDSMTASPTTIRADQNVREAAELMKDQDIGDLVVVYCCASCARRSGTTELTDRA